MRFLLLDGHGIGMKVENSKLLVKDGLVNVKENPSLYVYSPRRIDIDHIIVNGRAGVITLDSIRWLAQHNVPVTFLNWNGKVLSSLMPKDSMLNKVKIAQYEFYTNTTKRVDLARHFILGKINKTQMVLDWLHQRYQNVNNKFPYDKDLSRCKTVKDVMLVEANYASFFWQEFAKITPKEYEFTSRETNGKPRKAADKTNTLLNYGYALLESRCLKAINSAGLDPSIGFLHHVTDGRNSLVHDLQEPFRFLIDLTVIQIIEKNLMDKKDFVMTEDFNLRLHPKGAKKIIEEVQSQLNGRVKYGKRMETWDNIIQLKARELTSFLIGKHKNLDFSEPSQELERLDNEEIRQKILNISYYKWKQAGYSKGTLAYLKQNAKQEKPFSINQHVYERLQEW